MPPKKNPKKKEKTVQLPGGNLQTTFQLDSYSEYNLFNLISSLSDLLQTHLVSLLSFLNSCHLTLFLDPASHTRKQPVPVTSTLTAGIFN